MRVILSLLALVLLGAAAVPPAQGKDGCPTTVATVVAGAGEVIEYDFSKPVDPTTGDIPHAPLGGRTIDDDHGYAVTGTVRIRFGRTVYVIDRGSRFQLGCYGQVRGGKLYPSLLLNEGSATVRAVPGQPGGVATREALINPIGTGQRLTYEVVRRGGLTGRTTVTARKRGKVMGVTPYIGPRPGTCIYGSRYTLDGKRDRVSYS